MSAPAAAPTSEFQQLIDAIGITPDEWLSICHDIPGIADSFTGVPRNATIADSTVASLTKQDPPRNVWFGVNTLAQRKGMTGRGKAADVARVTCLWADLDIKEGSFETVQDAQAFIYSVSAILEAQPAAVVWSGHGLQPYWRLDGGKDVDRARGLVGRFKYLVQGLAMEGGVSLDSVWDLARVMRAPGTTNTKPMQPPVDATLIEVCEDPDVLTLDDLEDRLIAAGVGEGITDVTGEAVVLPAKDWPADAKTCGYVRAMINGWATDVPTKGRHPWLVSQAVRLAAARRSGCLTTDDWGTAAGKLIERFEWLCANREPKRPMGATEWSSILLWALDKAERKTDEQIAEELGKHEHKEDVSSFEEQVFGATDRMDLIRQAARARRVSPWAVLGDLLARVASDTEPQVTLPPIIGGRASLNFSVALVSKSGGGKSAAHAVGRELDLATTAHQIGPGSGEGIIETFLKWIPPDKKAGIEGHFEHESTMRALLYADEIAQVGAVKDRSGATFDDTIRSMWSGTDVSNTNTKSGGRRRHLGAHSYRLAIVAGVQEGLSDILLNDTDAGTPQRWLWMPAEDPAMPDERPEWPKLPSILGLWDTPKMDPFTVAPEIEAFIDGEHVARNRGEGEALDGHAVLTRLKVAALLTILHDMPHHVGKEMWDLAGWIQSASDRVRYRCQLAMEEQQRLQQRGRGKSDYIRSAGAREALEDDLLPLAEKVAKVIHTGKEHQGSKHKGTDGCTKVCCTYAMRHAPKGADRDAAVRLAIDMAWVEVGEDGRFYPGPSQPTEEEK